METTWISATTMQAFGSRTKLRVEVGDVAVALFRSGGRIYAFQDSCVHQERSLVKGTLLHGRVICPGHQWAFDLENGYEEDQDLCQPTFAVKVENGEIFVDPTRRPVFASSASNDTGESE